MSYMRNLSERVIFRVSAEMKAWADEVGSEVLREALLEKMHPQVAVKAVMEASAVDAGGSSGLSGSAATPAVAVAAAPSERTGHVVSLETGEGVSVPLGVAPADKWAAAVAANEAKLRTEAEKMSKLTPTQRQFLKP